MNKTTYTVNDDLSIKNIVGYNQVISRDRLDADGSPFQILTTGATGGPNEEGVLYSTEQYSEELQLAGTALAKRLNYLVGGYYDRDNEGAEYPCECRLRLHRVSRDPGESRRMRGARWFSLQLRER